MMYDNPLHSELGVLGGPGTTRFDGASTKRRTSEGIIWALSLMTDNAGVTDTIRNTRLFRVQRRSIRGALKSIILASFFVTVFMGIGVILLLALDSTVWFWYGLSFIGPTFCGSFILLLKYGNQLPVQLRNERLLRRAAKLTHKQLAIGSVMSVIVCASEKEPSLGVAVASLGVGVVCIFLGLFMVVASPFVLNKPFPPLPYIGRAVAYVFFGFAFLNIVAAAGIYCKMAPKMHEKHEQMADQVTSLFERAQRKVRFINMDDETLNMRVQNDADPDISTLEQYMEVGECTHPKARVMLRDSPVRGEVISTKMNWVYKAGTKYTVLLDGSEEELIEVDGSNLRMVQHAVQTPAIQFSQEWDPATDPLIDFFITHSWTDDTNENAGKKMRALMELNRVFKKRFGRPMRIWYEKFCIPQGEALDMANCALLPAFIACSKTLIVMHSASWRQRLWCLTELGDHVLMGSDTCPTPVLICDMDGSFEQGSKGLNLTESVCGNPADEVNLRRAISQIPHGESVGFLPLGWLLPRMPWFIACFWATGLGCFGGIPDENNGLQITGGCNPTFFERLVLFGKKTEDGWLRQAHLELNALDRSASNKGYQKLVSNALTQRANHVFGLDS
jgi:hypothetical protein